MGMAKTHRRKPHSKDFAPPEYKSERFGTYIRQRAFELIRKIKPRNIITGIRPFPEVRQIVCGVLAMKKGDFWDLILTMARENNPKIKIVPLHGIQVLDEVGE
jgi:hypothetical protein